VVVVGTVVEVVVVVWPTFLARGRLSTFSVARV
jgi:hypothetical protein